LASLGSGHSSAWLVLVVSLSAAGMAVFARRHWKRKV
jgi:hypothetical protein